MSSPFGAYPPRPPHVAEWEELLLRYELTPRAMGNALDEESVEVASDLGRIVAAERAATDWLNALRTGDEIAAEWQPEPESGDAKELLTLFADLRARNFATLQRRGPRVWDWTARHPAWGEVTTYQLLAASVARDAREMAAIRDACAATGRPC